MSKYKYEEAAIQKERTVIDWHCRTCGAMHGSYPGAEDKAARCCTDEAPCANEGCSNIIDYRGKYRGYRSYNRICKFSAIIKMSLPYFWDHFNFSLILSTRINYLYKQSF